MCDEVLLIRRKKSSMNNKKFAIGATVSVMMLGSVAFAPSVMAAVVDGVTPVVTVLDDDKIVDYWSHFQIRVELDIPNSANSGDTFTLALDDSRLDVVTDPIELISPDGELVATVTPNGDGTFTYVFTEYVDTHENVSTWVQFWVSIDRQKVDQGTSFPVIVEVNDVQSTVTADSTVSTRPAGNSASAYKYMGWLNGDQSTGQISYGVVVTPQDVDRNSVTIVDKPANGATLLCPANGGGITVYLGDRNNFSYGHSTMLPSSAYMFNCNPSEMTIVVNPNSDTNNDGIVNQNDTVIPAGASLEVRGRMVVDDRARTTYTNNATIYTTTGRHVDTYETTINVQKVGSVGGAVGVDGAVNVGDRVWFDFNRNGVQDSGENGIEGVTLNIAGPNGKTVADINGNPVAPAVTDSDGNYAFNSLPILKKGQYYSVFLDENASLVALGDLVPTLSNVGDMANDSSTNVATSGDLTFSRATDLTLDFGFMKGSVTVGDRVWFDSNGNGTQDENEPGIKNVNISIQGPDGLPVTDVYGNTVGNVTTGPNGEYSFTNLPVLEDSQNYTVIVDENSPGLFGLTPTESNVGGRSTDSSNQGESTIGLTAHNEIDDTIDFGYVKGKVSVGNFVWEDVNKNGIQDENEPGIQGVTLNILDPNGNPATHVDGTLVPPAITTESGEYLFSNLPTISEEQSYTVIIDNEASAEVLKDFDPTVREIGDNRESDSSTGSSVSTIPLTQEGATDLSNDFGFVKNAPTPPPVVVIPSVSVGNYVWMDSDRDGIQDSDESGIEGVSLALTGPEGEPVENNSGNIVESTVTDGNGWYSFNNLPALIDGESYTVTVDNNSESLNGLTPTVENAGDDVAGDSSTLSADSVSLTTNDAVDDTLDFGFVATVKENPPVVEEPAVVSVGDRVWQDNNKNGIQDTGEPGISGVKLVLLDSAGEAVINPENSVEEFYAITDENGFYSFENLPALNENDFYTVGIDRDDEGTAVVLENYSPTLSNQGDSREDDSSLWVSNTEGLNLDGSFDYSLDFGFVVNEIVVNKPIEEEPVEEEPVVEEPVKEEPVKEEPIEDNPVIEEPIVEEPVIDETVEEPPLVEKPVEEEPVIDKETLIVETPTNEEPVVINEPVVKEKIIVSTPTIPTVLSTNVPPVTKVPLSKPITNDFVTYSEIATPVETDKVIVSEQPKKLAKTGFGAGVLSLMALVSVAGGAGIIRVKKKFDN